jgi:predicted Zn-dependent peptidase
MKIKTLPNKLTYIIDNSVGKKSASILLGVKVGSRNEQISEYGLSHFLEHMLFKGTKKRKESKDVSNSIYKYGASFNAFTNYDMTCYEITISSENLENALEVLADMMFNSTLVDLKPEIGVVVSENKKSNSNPIELLFEKCNNQVFKNTTFAHSIGGHNTTIKKFNKPFVKKFYKKYYSSNNMILSISGKTPKNIDKIIRKHFNINRINKIPSTPSYNNFINFQKKNTFKSLVKSFPQSYVGISFPLYNYHNQKTYPFDLIDTILCGNMSARLFVKLRDKSGLVYIINSDTDYFNDVGVYTIYFGTYPDKIKKAYNIVINELVDLKTNLVSNDELKKAINYSIGSLKLSSENTEYIAYNNFAEYYYTKKIIPMNTVFKKIKKVKPIDIKNVANQIFDFYKINVTVVNNKKIKNFIKPF